MKRNDRLNKTAEIITMVLVTPVALTFGVGMYLVDKFILDDNDRYELGKKW